MKKAHLVRVSFFHGPVRVKPEGRWQDAVMRASCSLTRAMPGLSDLHFGPAF